MTYPPTSLMTSPQVINDNPFQSKNHFPSISLLRARIAPETFGFALASSGPEGQTGKEVSSRLRRPIVPRRSRAYRQVYDNRFSISLRNSSSSFRRIMVFIIRSPIATISGLGLLGAGLGEASPVSLFFEFSSIT
jgi:hypothetical protein